MNKENLKELKEDLEDLLEIQNQYVAVSQISKNGIFNAGSPMQSGEVYDLGLKNTYEVAKQCDLLIKKAVVLLKEQGIDINQLVISSNMGVFCRLDYFNMLKKYYQKNNATSEEFDSLIRTLHIKTYPKIVPVKFSVNKIHSGIKKCNLNGLETISGVVNWEKFANEMWLLGYNVEFSNYKNGLSEFNYIMAVKQNTTKAQINITADSEKIKKYTFQKK